MTLSLACTRTPSRWLVLVVALHLALLHLVAAVLNETTDCSHYKSSSYNSSHTSKCAECPAGAETISTGDTSNPATGFAMACSVPANTSVTAGAKRMCHCHGAPTTPIHGSFDCSHASDKYGGRESVYRSVHMIIFGGEHTGNTYDSLGNAIDTHAGVEFEFTTCPLSHAIPTARPSTLYGITTKIPTTKATPTPTPAATTDEGLATWAIVLIVGVVLLICGIIAFFYWKKQHQYDPEKDTTNNARRAAQIERIQDERTEQTFEDGISPREKAASAQIAALKTLSDEPGKYLNPVQRE